MDKISESARNLSARGTIDASYVDSLNNDDSFAVAVKGSNIFRMIAETVARAKQEVLIQTFAWESNIQGVTWLRDALIIAAQNLEPDSDPIRVFIQIDERGPLSTMAFSGKKYMEWKLDIESIGLESHEKLDINISTYYHDSIASNHGKTVNVDGKILIITGANFQASNFHEYPAHEAAYLIRGPIALGARMDFDYMWQRRKNPNNTPSLPNLKPSELEDDESENTLRILLLTRTPQIIRSVNFIDNPQNGAIHTLIQNASRIIRIATPNLNAPFIVKDLVEFVNRGGRLELMLGHSFNDKRESTIFIGGTNQYTVDKLNRKVEPAQMQNMDIRWFSLDGIKPVIGNVAGASHLKFMAVDDTFLLVGNSNLDIASTTHLHEVNILVESQPITVNVTQNVFEAEFTRSVKAQPSPSKLETLKHYVGFRGLQQKLANEFRTTIVNIRDDGEGYKTLKLVRPDGFNFMPGQYIQIRVINDKAHLLNSSLLAIASGKLDPHLEITARSSKLPWNPNNSLDKKIGNSFSFEGPIGTSFPLDTDSNILLIGGGSGITPIRSVIRSLTNQEYELIYSTKTFSSLLYSNEMIGKYNHTISLTQEVRENFMNARVTDILQNKDIDDDVICFICGPLQLVKDVRALLVNKNVSVQRIYCSMPFDALRGGPVYRGDHPCFN